MSLSFSSRAGVTLLGLLVFGASLPYTAASLARHHGRHALRRHALAVPQAASESFRAECEAQFSKVRQTVRDRFYDPRLNGVDWDKIGADYRTRLSRVR